jgi:hypothetical protein
VSAELALLRELVALQDIREKYEQQRPDSAHSPQWRQYLADVESFNERSAKAWDAARAFLGLNKRAP